MYQYFSHLAALGPVRYRYLARLQSKRRLVPSKLKQEEDVMEETDEEIVL